MRENIITIGNEFFFKVRVFWLCEFGHAYIHEVRLMDGTKINRWFRHVDEIVEKINVVDRGNY